MPTAVVLIHAAMVKLSGIVLLTLTKSSPPSNVTAVPTFPGVPNVGQSHPQDAPFKLPELSAANVLPAGSSNVQWPLSPVVGACARAGAMLPAKRMAVAHADTRA